MTHETLKERLREQPFLVATMDGQIRLYSRADATKLLIMEGCRPTVFLTDLEGTLSDFARLEPDTERTFNTRDLAKCAGMGEPSLYRLVSRLKIMEPSVRPFTGQGRREALFSWADCFVAGVIGVLWRNRLPAEVLGQVQSLLQGPTKQQRTGGKRQLATRS